MRFEKALEEMRNGKHIRLPNWANDKSMYIKDSMLFTHQVASTNILICWPIDICSEEWEVLA